MALLPPGHICLLLCPCAAPHPFSLLMAARPSADAWECNSESMAAKWVITKGLINSQELCLPLVCFPPTVPPARPAAQAQHGTMNYFILKRKPYTITHIKLKLHPNLLSFGCVWLLIVLLQGEDCQTSTLQPLALPGFPRAAVGLGCWHSQGPGKGWVGIPRAARSPLPLLHRHWVTAELEVTGLMGALSCAAGSSGPGWEDALFIHTLHRPSITLLFRRARASLLTSHTFALRRVGDMLGTEAVFCGLPSGGSCWGRRGTLGPISATHEREEHKEIMTWPLRLKWLLVYMLILAKSFSVKKKKKKSF